MPVYLNSIAKNLINDGRLKCVDLSKNGLKSLEKMNSAQFSTNKLYAASIVVPESLKLAIQDIGN